MTTKIHAICDVRGRCLHLSLSAGNESDFAMARNWLNGKLLPKATAFVADRGYDAKWLRRALHEQGITSCIPQRTHVKRPTPFCKETYKLRWRVENFFSRLKDWRRIATRYDRNGCNFLGACQLVAACLSYVF
jgi:transposase